MTRKEYNKLVNEISNTYTNRELESEHFATNAVNNVLIAAGVEIPEPDISEQVWNAHAEREGFSIYSNGEKIATVYSKRIRNVFVNIPTLIKACKAIDEEATTFGGNVPQDQIENMREALKPMRSEDD